MKFTKLTAVAALLCSSGAFAATSLGTLSSTATSLSTPLAFLTNDYTFKISTGGTTLNGVAGGSFFMFGGDVQLFSGTAPAPYAPYLYKDTSPSSFTFAGLSAGTYTLRLDGYTFLGNITGSVSVSSLAAPVPEAENYAMLAVGLSGVGLIGLRKSRRSN